MALWPFGTEHVEDCYCTLSRSLSFAFPKSFHMNQHGNICGRNSCYNQGLKDVIQQKTMPGINFQV